VMSDSSTVEHFRQQHAACEIRYGDMKKQLAGDINKFIAPIRGRIHEILSDDACLSKVIREGAGKARESAGKTIREVREIIGYRSTR
ncbi:MAG: tryptophan--tRNA ligase, partial [Bacteroidota bacterium]